MLGSRSSSAAPLVCACSLCSLHALPYIALKHMNSALMARI